MKISSKISYNPPPEPSLDPQWVRWMWQTLLGMSQEEIELHEQHEPAGILEQELIELEAVLACRNSDFCGFSI